MTKIIVPLAHDMGHQRRLTKIKEIIQKYGFMVHGTGLTVYIMDSARSWAHRKSMFSSDRIIYYPCIGEVNVYPNLNITINYANEIDFQKFQNIAEEIAKALPEIRTIEVRNLNVTSDIAWNIERQRLVWLGEYIS